MAPVNPWVLPALTATLWLPALASTAFAEAGNKDLQVAETILLYQRENGGWPKNYDRDAELSEEEREDVRSKKARDDTTFDNGATYSELAHLAKVYSKTGDDRFREAFLRGLEFTLDAQYPSGGWPQYHPEARGYHAHITFNDGAMTGVLRLLRAVGKGDAPYAFVDDRARERCREAVEKGVRCILECQIEVAGKKTAWCAQHDARSLEPRKGRSYELASISGSESAGVVRFLLEIEEPSLEVIEAIHGAVAWFEEAKLTGIRVEKVEDRSAPKGYDRVVVEDPSAPPLWARFYEIGTNEPIFCSRDGVPKRALAEISYERRNGYSWLGSYASRLLAKEYPEWKERVSPGE